MKKYLLPVILLSILSLTVTASDGYAFSQSSSGKHQNMPSRQGISVISGKVVETMDSGGYTYIGLEKNGKKTWAAVPKTKIEVGQSISLQPGMTMNDFTSKTLGRTFETIIFSSGTAEEAGTTDDKSSVLIQAKAADAKKIKVEKAAGPDAYTVEELHEMSSTLDQKNVVVRGQVVKFSPKIMGKNWIHIQDGSGNPSKGTNDVLVTSQEELSVDDVVTIKGTLSKDKDFGGRYKYAVIVEQASVVKSQ